MGEVDDGELAEGEWMFGVRDGGDQVYGGVGQLQFVVARMWGGSPYISCSSILSTIESSSLSSSLADSVLVANGSLAYAGVRPVRSEDGAAFFCGCRLLGRSEMLRMVGLAFCVSICLVWRLGLVGVSQVRVR